MAYIGRGLDIGEFAKTSITTGNGVLTAFNVLKWNVSQNSLLVVYGGVIQEPGVSYTVSSTTITFTSPFIKLFPSIYPLNSYSSSL